MIVIADLKFKIFKTKDKYNKIYYSISIDITQLNYEFRDIKKYYAKTTEYNLNKYVAKQLNINYNQFKKLIRKYNGIFIRNINPTDY